ncbi:YadA-like family protein [Pasteurella sp. PK-2025]|uniref:YadA-like family protein n=1 Tax=Pasteurella sp. PK-2025 TaxID=3413133 RepID=UPI003C738C18
MNKIFKIVWSQATQTWVAVSELGSTKGKTKSRSVAKAVVTTITLGMGLATSTLVLGADLHFFSVKTGQTDAASNYNNDRATEEDSVSIGILTNATAVQAIAIGSEATASGKQSLAIGNNIVASKLGATAIGNNSKATAEGAQAFGQSSNAAAKNSAAIGRLATATGERASAFGVGNTAAGASSFSGGDKSNALGANTVAIGSEAVAQESNTVSIGTKAGTAGVDFVNKGPQNKLTERTNQGKTSASGLLSGVNIGNEAGLGTINNQYGVNIGHKAGNGYNSYYGEGVSIGHNAGSLDSRNPAVKQAMDTASKAKGATNGVIITGNTNTAISSRAGMNTLGHDNVAIGKEAGGYSSGNANIAIGRHAGRASKLDPATNDESKRMLDESIFSKANNTMSMGEWAYASADDSLALGRRAQTSGVNGIAIGKDAQVTNKNSVALGADSKDRAATVEDSATVNGISYSNFAGNEKADGSKKVAEDISVVSVGSANNERQIIHVAPGKISETSTDAINGSQLYMTQHVIGNISQAVANLLGGGTAVNQATGAPGGFTQTLNVTGAAKDAQDYTPAQPAQNVAEAITQLNSYVNDGWKLGDQSGTVVDRVTPNDQVNFKNGSNTNVQVTSDGKSSDIVVNVVGLPVQYTQADGTPVVKVGDNYYPVKEDGSPDMDNPIPEEKKADLVVNVINPTAKPNESGNATKLGNIASGTNTLDGTTDANGKPLVKIGDQYYNPEDIDETGKPIKGKNPVTNLAQSPNPALKGLADLVTSNPNNAVTVSDLRKMGWVLSGKGEDGNQYSSAVKNADEVNFIGKGLANVTVSKNATTGAQDITVDVKEGDIVKENEGTATVNGEQVEVVKDKNGNYYKKSDLDPTTGEAKPNATPLTQEEIKTVVNNGGGLVTGHKVAEAIQKSGWTVGKIVADTLFDSKVTFNNQDEKVNPNDHVRFADGKNTVASLGTVKAVDEEGNTSTTTVVKVDVDLPIDFKYTDASGKEFVKANDGKFYAKDDVGNDGVPKDTTKALPDDKVNELKKGAQLTDGSNSNGQPNKGYELQDPIQIAVQQAVEKAAKEVLTANPNASAAEIAAAVEKATEQARIEAVKANPEAKDKITAGTGGVNLNNVAWADKPDQAVNKDQLDQTVSKSGFFVEQNGKSTNGEDKATEKVTPNDVVNFVNGANTVVTAETTRDESTGTDKTEVKVNVSGLPISYTTKVEGKEVPVVKVGDQYYPVGADGKPDMTKPVADVSTLSTQLVNPAAGKDEIGKPSQLGNVAAGTNTLDGTTDANGKPLVKIGDQYYNPEDIDETGQPIAGKDPVTNITPNGKPALTGLADLATSNPNNAVTVSDLRKMGWVLSGKGEDGNHYSSAVKNADEVNFIGKGLANVTVSKNATTGAQDITIDVKEGDIVKENEGTATVNGEQVEVVKDKNGNYYKKSDLDPTTGEVKPNATPLTPEEVKTVVNNGGGFVTGHKVAEAIQKSGWTVGKIEADALFDSNVIFNNQDEKVNPNDHVRFADGKNTVASLGTVKAVDEEGKISTTTVVKVDVDLPIDFKYTDASGKEFVKANDGKFYAKDEVGVDGVPSNTAQALTDDQVIGLKKGAQLTDGSNSNGQPNEGYEVKDPIQIAVQQAGEKAIKAILTANPNASAAEIAAAVEKATEQARIEAVKANPEAKDKITAGTGGVNLNNVAWADKPDQAVNKDQLDQTVSKSGFFVEQNGKSTNGEGKATEKVTPNDVVNFVNGANTVVTAETTRDETTGTDKTEVKVNVSGLPISYTTKVEGKEVPVVKVGDQYFPVGADGKPDMTKPVADVSTLSTQLVNPAAGKDEIGKPSQLGNVANGANTFASPQVEGETIKLANDGKWYLATQVEPNGEVKAGSVPVPSDKVKQALNAANNGGLVNFAASNPNNAATVGDLQNLGFMISTGDDQYKEQVRHNNRIEFVSGNKNASVTGLTRPDGVREVKVTISDNPIFKTVQLGSETGPKMSATPSGDIRVSKQENGNENAPARITNVAPGVDGHDAVNVNQLNEIKQNLGNVNNLIHKNNKKLHAGIAGSNAAAGLPQVYIPGKSMVAASAGTYGGQNAVAIGYSRSSDNGKVILKIQGNANTSGRVGGSVGVGYQW